MNAKEFCYWLDGYIRVGRPDKISRNELDRIKRQLVKVKLEDESDDIKGVTLDNWPTISG